MFTEPEVLGTGYIRCLQFYSSIMMFRIKYKSLLELSKKLYVIFKKNELIL